LFSEAGSDTFWGGAAKEPSPLMNSNAETGALLLIAGGCMDDGSGI